MNLSIGYYYEHTEFEHLKFHEWKHTLDIARKMLESKQKKFLLNSQRETSVQRKIRMDKLIRIFADTQLFYTNEPILIEAVKFGKQHTKLYKADDYPILPEIPNKKHYNFRHDDTCIYSEGVVKCTLILKY